MIVECPECGARNRIPDRSDLGRIYRCSRCKARLPTAQYVAALDPQDSEVSSLEIDKAPTWQSGTLRSSVSALLNRLARRERLLLGLLALLLLALHLYVIPIQDTLIYDEAYYVPAARSIVEGGELLAAEHPPLAKLLISFGITVFGDNQWGWRIPSIIFSVALVVFFYYLCRELAGRNVALFSTLIFAFETLVFNYSGLAMLVVFSTAFMLLAFLFYLRGHYVISGILITLSGLCRMTGFLGLLPILVHWLWTMKVKKK